MNKSSILEVVGERVQLRKVGKEYAGLCPFHPDKNPSFTVNEEKGVFYCFGCGAGGDVFDFVMKLDGVTFAEARKSLCVNSSRERPNPDPIKRRAAVALASWLNGQHLKVGVLLREFSRKIALAEKMRDPELVASLEREWEILSDFHEDLQNPTYAEELFRGKDFIEGITSWAEPEPLPTFPELTLQYREYLKAAARGELC